MTSVLQKVSKSLHQNNLSVSTAESCTGGWVAKKLTDLAGSSAIFDRGFVTYSNDAKHEMLGVSKHTLDEHGAVSEEVVIEMVVGALDRSNADIAVSISGVAGPSGGTDIKPVGMVCFAWMLKGNKARAETTIFSGDRKCVRKQAVEYALEGILELIEG